MFTFADGRVEECVLFGNAAALFEEHLEHQGPRVHVFKVLLGLHFEHFLLLMHVADARSQG